jgi:hypothetical protein
MNLSSVLHCSVDVEVLEVNLDLLFPFSRSKKPEMFNMINLVNSLSEFQKLF